MGGRRTGLDPEDRALWERLARSVRPLHPRPVAPPAPLPGLPPDPPPPPEPAPRPPAAWPAAPPPRFRIGEAALPRPETRIDPADPGPAPGPSALAFHRRTRARLARGAMGPEARIDLHGLTLAEAQPELVRFILAQRAAGRRLVLVITGKGRGRAEGAGPVPDRPGALRRHVPEWLARPPLAAAVVQVTEAHLRHGGAGAFYVVLRRLR